MSWVVLFRSGYLLSAIPLRLAEGSTFPFFLLSAGGSVEETSPLHGEMAEARFLRQIGGAAGDSSR